VTIDGEIREQIAKDALVSVFIYALPVLLMLLTFHFTGHRPWQSAPLVRGTVRSFEHLDGSGLLVFAIALGVLEFALGLYGNAWDKNEKTTDLVCFVFHPLIVSPFFAWFGLKVLPFSRQAGRTRSHGFPSGGHF